ncbi:hypothetical protein SAMN04489760_14115 [Syntrophus gentianae]|uniref:tRNA(Ile2) 2-agmatinylcytidine synthetase n=1 Tax=Syntrophus gentianae TaxID=43775 RepID=A0A1H8AXB9_9BACT|nr:hypothetical protein [Syntrophus gentianae]SEM74438.1 hypothetical protein SAMN04489760_14115 [Syntrophus gentianae]
MKLYIGFDDTDNAEATIGTGKLARHFEELLPEKCRVWGVVRQQLLVDPGIPYTSHNSSACVILDIPDSSFIEVILERATGHIEKESLPGSDPGLCLAPEGHPDLSGLIAFGQRCTEKIVTQREAMEAAKKIHLSGHGGTNGGIIGAAAGVGLSASGWSGRFIEFGNLRAHPELVSVSTLTRCGISVVSLDRDAIMPHPDDTVFTKGWLRPRFWGQRAVLPVVQTGKGQWESLGGKRKNNNK